MKPLKKIKEDELYYSVGEKLVMGTPKEMTNINPFLFGDCTDLKGDCSGLWGDCSNIWGDCTGLSGSCSSVTGHLDLIPKEARPCDIKDWIE